MNILHTVMNVIYFHINLLSKNLNTLNKKTEKVFYSKRASHMGNKSKHKWGGKNDELSFLWALTSLHFCGNFKLSLLPENFLN